MHLQSTKEIILVVTRKEMSTATLAELNTITNMCIVKLVDIIIIIMRKKNTLVDIMNIKVNAVILTNTNMYILMNTTMSTPTTMKGAVVVILMNTPTLKLAK